MFTNHAYDANMEVWECRVTLMLNDSIQSALYPQCDKSMFTLRPSH